MVHSARTAGVLSARMARWSCVCVVGVLVILYAVVSDDVGDRAAIDCKQQRAKHRPLWDAYVDLSGM